MDDGTPLKVLAALANVERIRIAALIAERSLSAAEIVAETGLGQEAVTAHLTVLGQAGLIATSKDRHERRLSLRTERLKRVAETLTGWHSDGMARAYSLDLRERLLRARDAGVAPVEIERTFGISTRTQRRWVAQHRTTGSLAPRTGPGRPPVIGPDHVPQLRAQVAAHADATLAEHCQQWAATTGVRMSPATMSRQFTKLGLPLKKRR